MIFIPGEEIFQERTFHPGKENIQERTL